MIRRICSFLTLSILLSLFIQTPGYAQRIEYPSLISDLQSEIQTREISFTELGYTKDDTYKGVLASRDYSVRWPDSWQVQPGNILRLVYSHSPVLHPRSSLVVDWNGIRLTSVMLTSVNTDRAVLEIPIPETLIVTGYNRLHVEFYMGIDDEDFCADEDNPGLWATIHAESIFTAAFSLNTPTLDLGLFPQPLVDNSQLVDNNVTFILPTNPTPSELNAAAIISAGLGKLAAWHMVSLQASDPAAPTPGGDLVVIGKVDRMPLLTSSALPYLKKEGNNTSLQDASGNPLPAETGVLWEEISPTDPTAAALYVTGSSDQAVLVAARALASSVTTPRLSGPLALIQTVPEPVKAGPGSKQSFTLEELGYPDLQARGTREQNITYFLPLEQSWQNESEVLLDLHFGHSNILHSRRSSVTVEVNGTAAGSVALDLDNAEDAHTTFHLPARLFKVGNNNITVSANLRLPDDIEEDWDCMADHSLDSWFVVFADSLISLPGGTSGAFVTLADFPSAFIGSDSLADVAFIVPEHISMEIASAVMRIAEGLGDASVGDNFYPRVFPAAEFGSVESQYRYLYLVGRPSQNAAIASINDSLPLPFLAGTDEPQDVEGVARLISGASSIGYIQAFLGKLGFPNVVVTGNSDEGVLWAANILQNPTSQTKFSGDLAILDGPTSLISSEIRFKSVSRFETPIEVELPSSGVNIAGAAVNATLWMIYAGAGVFLLALLILIIYALVEIQHRQKARSHYGSHSA